MFIRKSKRMFAAASALPRRPKIAGDIAGAAARRRFRDAAQMARTASRRPDVFAEKALSRRYNYLWLCNPKVASRSIIAALTAADPGVEVIRDMSIAQLRRMRPETEDYYTFGFVRDPLTRAYSFYRDLQEGHLVTIEEKKPRKWGNRSELLRVHHGLAEVGAFEEYCEWLNTPYGSDAFANRHFLSQSAHLRLPDGRLPDFIGRLESLDADFSAVTERLGLPETPVPLLNTMAGWEARREEVESARAEMNACLTPRALELLRARYAEDYELGGYTASAEETTDKRARRTKKEAPAAAAKTIAPPARAPVSAPLVSVVVEMGTRKITGRIAVYESVNAHIDQGVGFAPNEVEFIIVGNDEIDVGAFGDNVVSVAVPDGGVYEFKNAGAVVARGKYVTFFDSDCRPSADYLKYACALLEESPNLAGVAGATKYDGGSYLTTLNTIINFGYLHNGRTELSQECPAMSDNVVIRRSAFPPRVFGDYSDRHGGDMFLTEYARRAGTPLLLDARLAMAHEDITYSFRGLLERHLRDIFGRVDDPAASRKRATIGSALAVALKSPKWRYREVKKHARFFGWKRPQLLAATLVVTLYGALDVGAVLLLAVSPGLFRKWLAYQFGEIGKVMPDESELEAQLPRAPFRSRGRMQGRRDVLH